MKMIKNPDRSAWKTLAARPCSNLDRVAETIKNILSEVKIKGDEALFKYTKRLDGVALNNLKVTKEEIKDGAAKVEEDLKAAIRLAKNNIEKYHSAQPKQALKMETAKGVTCWQKSVPIEKVGLYVPGGSAPLFSTVLMLGIPAKIAGSREIVLCTPPEQNGTIAPAILYTADLIGIKNIFKVGGAQAIGAMAYGSDTIPAVYKIFGPGNSYVTKAKEFVQQAGTAIDMPAGPSELLIIADGTCSPKFVAADLLSQAEHGPDSQVVLLSNDGEVIEKVTAEIDKQIDRLPRKKIAEKALKNSLAITFKSMETCLDFSNYYAPEHLIIAAEASSKIAGGVMNAGSVFIGPYSCESAGDYASGPNHTLPTNGFAKNYSGVSVDSFMKKISFQEITPEGLQNIGPAVERMAEEEGLLAHKKAVTVRLDELQ